ncbi:hypothetical protein ACIA8G_21470 [Lentzea sp. NPDC051213]|uniref:hypothetical protein n=1 Tax=Lentzea sp. NPDC051213 TaxID=3364126 RepID=UPI003793A231
MLERRWLHYAFLSVDGRLGLVANLAWLGSPQDGSEGTQRSTSILLIHRDGSGWEAGQFNTSTRTPPWSAFTRPHPHGQDGSFSLAAVSEAVAARLLLRRTGHPCTSQCAQFADGHFLRWQSEPGVLASGSWRFRDETFDEVAAVGYHERVRGRWGWPELGGWVFGFANQPVRTAAEQTRGPGHAVVFTLIQPPEPANAATASVMLWRSGRLLRHFPRRRVSVAVQGELDERHIRMVPELARLLGTPPMVTIPRRLVITAAAGDDRLRLDFRCESAARVVIPAETANTPFSVHEVIGAVAVEGVVSGRSVAFRTRGIVEFAGGSSDD